MAWILSAWDNEDQIKFIDQLLYESSKLKNWKYEKGFLKSPEFHNFYSLMWQMQIANCVQQSTGFVQSP